MILPGKIASIHLIVVAGTDGHDGKADGKRGQARQGKPPVNEDDPDRDNDRQQKIGRKLGNHVGERYLDLFDAINHGILQPSNGLRLRGAN